MVRDYIHFTLKAILLVGICKLGWDHFVYVKTLQETNKAQEVLLVELIKRDRSTVVEAKTNKETGDVIVRINGSDANLHFFPQLCPKVWKI